MPVPREAVCVRSNRMLPWSRSRDLHVADLRTLNIADHSTTAAAFEIAAAALTNHEDFVDSRAEGRWETLVAAFPATHCMPRATSDGRRWLLTSLRLFLARSYSPARRSGSE